MRSLFWPLSRKILNNDSVLVIVRDSPSSLRILWSAVIKSPNFSARGAASPVRLLEGVLVILVRKHTSQFRSFGKWVKILCFLDFDTTFVGSSESESWEMCAGAGTSVSSGSPANSSNHSGRSRKRSSESRLPSLFFFWLWVFEGSHQFPGTNSSLRSDTALEDELDESCGVDVADELLPELVDTPGTTRGTELSVSHFIVFHSLVKRGFDRWPTRRNICGLRRVFQAIEQQAFLRVIALSRRDQNGERILVLPLLFALLRWPLPSLWELWIPAESTFRLSSNPFCSARCSGVNHEFSFLGRFWGGRRRHCSGFNRRVKRSVILIFEPVDFFRQVPCHSAGASFLVQGFLLWPLHLFLSD